MPLTHSETRLYWTGPDRGGRQSAEDVVLALGIPSAPMQAILATRYNTAESENAAFLCYVLCIPTLAFFIWLTE